MLSCTSVGISGVVVVAANDGCAASIKPPYTFIVLNRGVASTPVPLPSLSVLNLAYVFSSLRKARVQEMTPTSLLVLLLNYW